MTIMKSKYYKKIEADGRTALLNGKPTLISKKKICKPYE
jgi:hypothetical protein